MYVCVAVVGPDEAGPGREGDEDDGIREGSGAVGEGLHSVGTVQ